MPFDHMGDPDLDVLVASAVGAPMIVTLLVGALVIVTQSSAIAPGISTLFSPLTDAPTDVGPSLRHGDLGLRRDRAAVLGERLGP